ncbi:MAG: hypothetical protein ACI90G_002623, partial [Urechidicola sp.]
MAQCPIASQRLQRKDSAQPEPNTRQYRIIDINIT